MVHRAPIEERVGIVTIVEEAGGGVWHQDFLLGEVMVRRVNISLIREHRMHALT